MDKVTSYVIRVTDEYDKFKRCPGNRAVEGARIAKIRKSIEDVGLLPAAIIVNENYEICDGQGRFEACKRLNKPVYYIVVNGIGHAECTALNIASTNWKVIDYIRSYAELGDDNYERLVLLLDEYGSKLSTTCILVSVLGTDGFGVNHPIVKGELNFTEEDLARTRKTCDYWTTFTAGNILGSKKKFYTVLNVLEHSGEVDMRRLHDAVEKYGLGTIAPANRRDFAHAIEEAYNRNRRGNRVPIENIFLNQVVLMSM